LFNSKIVHTALDREMDRRQFLKIVGFVILGVIGFNKISNSLNQAIIDHEQATSINSERKATRGFGSSRFGV